MNLLLYLLGLLSILFGATSQSREIPRKQWLQLTEKCKTGLYKKLPTVGCYAYYKCNFISGYYTIRQLNCKPGGIFDEIFGECFYPGGVHKESKCYEYSEFKLAQRKRMLKLKKPTLTKNKIHKSSKINALEDVQFSSKPRFVNIETRRNLSHLPLVKYYDQGLTNSKTDSISTQNYSFRWNTPVNDSLAWHQEALKKLYAFLKTSKPRTQLRGSNESLGVESDTSYSNATNDSSNTKPEVRLKGRSFGGFMRRNHTELLRNQIPTTESFNVLKSHFQPDEKNLNLFNQNKTKLQGILESTTLLPLTSSSMFQDSPKNKFTFQDTLKPFAVANLSSQNPPIAEFNLSSTTEKSTSASMNIETSSIIHITDRPRPSFIGGSWDDAFAAYADVFKQPAASTVFPDISSIRSIVSYNNTDLKINAVSENYVILISNGSSINPSRTSSLNLSSVTYYDANNSSKSGEPDKFDSSRNNQNQTLIDGNQYSDQKANPVIAKLNQSGYPDDKLISQGSMLLDQYVEKQSISETSLRIEDPTQGSKVKYVPQNFSENSLLVQDQTTIRSTSFTGSYLGSTPPVSSSFGRNMLSRMNQNTKNDHANINNNGFLIYSQHSANLTTPTPFGSISEALFPFKSNDTDVSPKLVSAKATAASNLMEQTLERYTTANSVTTVNPNSKSFTQMNHNVGRYFKLEKSLNGEPNEIEGSTQNAKDKMYETTVKDKNVVSNIETSDWETPEMMSNKSTLSGSWSKNHSNDNKVDASYSRPSPRSEEIRLQPIPDEIKWPKSASITHRKSTGWSQEEIIKTPSPIKVVVNTNEKMNGNFGNTIQPRDEFLTTAEPNALDTAINPRVYGKFKQREFITRVISNSVNESLLDNSNNTDEISLPDFRLESNKFTNKILKSGWSEEQFHEIESVTESTNSGIDFHASAVPGNPFPKMQRSGWSDEAEILRDDSVKTALKPNWRTTTERFVDSGNLETKPDYDHVTARHQKMVNLMLTDGDSTPLTKPSTSTFRNSVGEHSVVSDTPQGNQENGPVYGRKSSSRIKSGWSEEIDLEDKPRNAGKNPRVFTTSRPSKLSLQSRNRESSRHSGWSEEIDLDETKPRNSGKQSIVFTTSRPSKLTLQPRNRKPDELHSGWSEELDETMSRNPAKHTTATTLRPSKLNSKLKSREPGGLHSGWSEEIEVDETNPRNPGKHAIVTTSRPSKLSIRSRNREPELLNSGWSDEKERLSHGIKDTSSPYSNIPTTDLLENDNYKRRKTFSFQNSNHALLNVPDTESDRLKLESDSQEYENTHKVDKVRLASKASRGNKSDGSTRNNDVTRYNWKDNDRVQELDGSGNQSQKPSKTRYKQTSKESSRSEEARLQAIRNEIKWSKSTSVIHRKSSEWSQEKIIIKTPSSTNIALNSHEKTENVTKKLPKSRKLILLKNRALGGPQRDDFKSKAVPTVPNQIDHSLLNLAVTILPPTAIAPKGLFLKFGL